MMSKFKVGDKVRVVASTFDSSTDNQAMIGYIYKVQGHDKNNNTYCVDYWSWFNESDLELVEKTWDTLEAGDVIEYVDGSTARVLAVCGEAFLRSMRSDHDSVGGWYTIAEAKKDGWKIKQPATSEPETIEILGKTYRKADVEGRLSGLEEV